MGERNFNKDEDLGTGAEWSSADEFFRFEAERLNAQSTKPLTQFIKYRPFDQSARQAPYVPETKWIPVRQDVVPTPARRGLMPARWPRCPSCGGTISPDEFTEVYLYTGLWRKTRRQYNRRASTPVNCPHCKVLLAYRARFENFEFALPLLIAVAAAFLADVIMGLPSWPEGWPHGAETIVILSASVFGVTDRLQRRLTVIRR
ncbi:hypothetical protein [Parvularcula sp. LCG005]|uniref:hypothetical protein n=1 Tax=Parvularcula sp. LCG005 TaxID=3078805 RepID=UPI002942413C|nr:hypothetical protein [Parvularcula sp. LCG005]WOI53384.1 hypothetical protein RUI03_14660 [Parvularcula sp. LCG005]